MRSVRGIFESAKAFDHVVAGIDEASRASESDIIAIEGQRKGRLLVAKPGASAACLSKQAPDLLHIHGALHPVYHQMAFAARSEGIPVVVSPRSALMYPENAALRRRAVRRTARGSLDRIAAMWHCTSDDEWSSLSGVTSQRMLVPNVFIPPPISATPFDRRGLLYLARVSKRKNTGQLVKAWLTFPARFREDNPLRIAGEIPEGEADPIGVSLRKAAESAGAEFHGHVSGKAKQDLIAKSAVLVHPSDFENFGHSLAEAIAGGLVVAVGPSTPFSEPLKSTGSGVIIRDPQDPNSIREAIEKAVGLEIDATNALNLVAPYSPEVLRPRYEELYSAALGH